MKDEKVLEKELQDFLHNNLWIIDFKYDKKRYKVETEFKTSIGNIDIILFPDDLNKRKEVIIELKRSNKNIILKYRKNKPAIRSEVGKAISQTIHYIENHKKPYHIIEGILIIGREDPTNFIKTFNEYLHGIQIITYSDLIRNCKEIIEVFKEEEKRDSEKETEN